MSGTTNSPSTEPPSGTLRSPAMCPFFISTCRLTNRGKLNSGTAPTQCPRSTRHDGKTVLRSASLVVRSVWNGSTRFRSKCIQRTQPCRSQRNARPQNNNNSRKDDNGDNNNKNDACVGLSVDVHRGSLPPRSIRFPHHGDQHEIDDGERLGLQRRRGERILQQGGEEAEKIASQAVHSAEGLVPEHHLRV